MNNKKTAKEIIVFFTLGVSLKSWVENGLLSREIKIYNKLINKGYKISFFTYGDHSDHDYNNLLGDIKVYPIFSSFKSTNNKIKKLFYILFSIKKYKKLFSRSDVFITNQMRGAWVPLICKILYNKPLITRCGHEWFRNALRDKKFGLSKIVLYFFGYIFELVIYTFSNKIIISSITDKNFINKLFPINNKKIFLIRNYIDTSIFNPENNFSNSKERKKSILYIGRIINRKNIDLIINSLSHTNYKLFIIGDGPEKDRLISLSKKLKVKIEFLGIFSNDSLPKIINQFPLFILPSFYENSPKTLLEAMSCGRAIISTNVDGINELIKHNNNGLLFDINEKSIISSIELIFNDNELRTMLGMNAKKFIDENCSLDIIAPKYEKLINNLA